MKCDSSVISIFVLCSGRGFFSFSLLMEGILGAADSTLLSKHEKLKMRVETLESALSRLEQQFQEQAKELVQLRGSRETKMESKRDLGNDLIHLKKNFEVRTRKHIAMVQRNLSLLAQANEDVAGQLADRGKEAREKILVVFFFLFLLSKKR